MGDDLKILIVNNDPTIRETLRDLLEPRGFHVRTAGDGIEALRCFDQAALDLVFTGLHMPRMGGMELLNRLKQRYPEVFVVLLTGNGTTELALKETSQAAFDYVLKPLDQKGLFALIDRVAEHKRFWKKSIYPHEDRRRTYRFENIIGKAPQMLDIFHRIQDVASADIPVLVTGESGTGKELVASAIHYTSTRKGGPYIKLNCASLPDGLIESELFGHEKGSFTTAVAQKKGRFELANGGTLFLDEIGEMPFQMQAKLLRVLDDGNFERVGGTKTLHSDVRIICATNKDIYQVVKERRIREDLFYRINAASIHLPPLRERGDDILLLTNYFVYVYAQKNNKNIKGLSKESYEIFMSYGWPGNVRELSNVVEQAVVFSKGSEITPDRLPEYMKKDFQPKKFVLHLYSRSLPLAESTLIRKVLDETNWNLKQAAKELEIARGTLYSKIKKYNIKRTSP
ncbi:MAG: sigma-54-dependent Fis family transcriptional regulator [Desulfobacterales bacterium]|nr:sigma-54-dependent Fis family transcriptional regulator [Desulfobacterales bacterium]